MSHLRSVRRLVPSMAVALIGNSLIAAPVQPPEAAPIAAIKRDAVQWGDASSALGIEESMAVVRLIGTAGIVALGEPAHGAREPLAQRNRLIRFLVERHDFAAVALETGFAGARRINDYVLGGVGDPRALALQYLNWGFGDLSSNLELIDWLRAYNQRHPGRQVRFYGIDVSGGDIKADLPGAGLPILDVAAYLERTRPKQTRAVTDILKSLASHFSPTGYAALSLRQRAALEGALAEAEDLFFKERSELIAASSVDEYDMALQEIVDGRRLAAIFAHWPSAGDSRLAGLVEVSDIRDRTMADHLLWVRRRELPRGRIVAFAHNGHVATSALVARSMTSGPRIPMNMGERLRASLGDDYRALIVSSAKNGPGTPAARNSAGSVDLALAQAGLPRLFLNLRETRETWWRSTQSIRIGFSELGDFIPARAADAILYIDSLTCDPPIRPVPTDCG